MLWLDSDERIERLYELFDIPARGDNMSRTSSQVGRAVRPPFSTPNLDFDDDEYQRAFEEAEYKRGVGSILQLGMNSSAKSWSAPATTDRSQNVEKESVHVVPVDSLSASSLRMRYPRASFTPLVRLLVVQIPEADPTKRLFDWVYEIRQEYQHVAHAQSPKTRVS